MLSLVVLDYGEPCQGFGRFLYIEYAPLRGPHKVELSCNSSALFSKRTLNSDEGEIINGGKSSPAYLRGYCYGTLKIPRGLANAVFLWLSQGKESTS